jgi:DNA invertase Pin-like site-specific DNA recombinase
MPVYREYTDYASGTNEIGRSEYQQMFADAEAGLFSQLAIHKWDRFGRNLLEALQAEERLTAFGVTICAANLQVDPKTYTGWMSKTIQQVLAQGYAMNLREEARKGQMAKAQAGGWFCQAPIGYRNVQRSDGRHVTALIEVDPERAAIVRRIFEMYNAGEHILGIAQRLNREGVPSPKGKRWQRPSVRHILRNAFYVGRLVARTYGVERDGDWEPLVSPETWQATQKRLAQRRRLRTAGRVFPLSGLLCWHDGQSLTGACFQVINAAGERVEYIYYEARREGRRRRFYRGEEIERQVREWLEHLRVAPDQVGALRAEYEEYIHEGMSEQRRDQIERRIVALSQEGDGLIRLAAKELISEAEFSTKRGEIAAEIGELRRQLSDLPHGKEQMKQFDDVAGMPAWLPETWAMATPEDRRTIAQTVFERIDISEDGQVVGVRYLPPFEQIAVFLAERS